MVSASGVEDASWQYIFSRALHMGDSAPNGRFKSGFKIGIATSK